MPPSNAPGSEPMPPRIAAVSAFSPEHRPKREMGRAEMQRMGRAGKAGSGARQREGEGDQPAGIDAGQCCHAGIVCKGAPGAAEPG